MVDIVSTESFIYERKYFAFFEGKGGNVEEYMAELEEVGILDREDSNTFITIYKYPYNKKSDLLRALNNLENDMIDYEGNSLFLPYFCGEGFMSGGLITAVMGEDVTLPIESKLMHICNGESE